MLRVLQGAALVAKELAALQAEAVPRVGRGVRAPVRWERAADEPLKHEWAAAEAARANAKAASSTGDSGPSSSSAGGSSSASSRGGTGTSGSSGSSSSSAAANSSSGGGHPGPSVAAAGGAAPAPSPPESSVPFAASSSGGSGSSSSSSESGSRSSSESGVGVGGGGGGGGSGSGIDGSSSAVGSSSSSSSSSAASSSSRPQRAVPTYAISRAMHFGGLGISLATGAAATAMRRAVGADEGSGSAMVNDANVERVAETLCRLRGAALKVGQMLSFNDADVLPPAMRIAMERVRDGADWMPERQLEATLREELGDAWREQLHSFEEVPVASASIGQVHKAVFHDGRQVAIKVQYPGGCLCLLPPQPRPPALSCAHAAALLPARRTPAPPQTERGRQ
jgi:aarF domain-containing kinase